MHKQLRTANSSGERVSWVLDDVWPETASVLAARFGPDDQLLTPGIFGAWPRRYKWPLPAEVRAALATARRHWGMRRVANTSGAVRQRAYLGLDRHLARQLAKHIDYRASHLVVAQSWLPSLDEAGVLGGRSFDVVMSRFPLGEIHRLLDEAANEMDSSATISDFRAPPELVAREQELLAQATRIYTPHTGIAALFPQRAVQLVWHKPPPRAREPGSRTAFLGPTIARQRPDVARKVASGLREPLVVFGPILEEAWHGMKIEKREKNSSWLDGISAILHPATITHEPRALLEARAAGVVIYATPSCGLEQADYLPIDRFELDRPS